MNQDQSELVFAHRCKEELVPSEPFVLGGKKILARLYSTVVEHEDGVRQANDIEYVHQTRIATRKMRTVFRHLKDALGAERFELIHGDLKRLAKTLGRARDLDSFIDYLEGFKQTLPENAQPAIDLIIEDRRKVRQSEQDYVLKELNSDEYAQLKENLRRLIVEDRVVDLETAPLKQAAPELLLKDFNQMLAYQDGIREYSLEELHRLRIETKHARYMSEFFAGIYDDDIRLFIEQLVEVQSLLGRVQDTRRDIEFFQTHADEIKRELPDEESRGAFDHVIEKFTTLQTTNLEKFYLYWGSLTQASNIETNRKIITAAIRDNK